MTSTIKIKNSSTAGAVPGSGDLVQGELAVNVTDKKIYTKNASGTIVNLGTTPSITDNGNAEAIVIDSSENVGIGVSPSAWSLIKAFQLPSGVYLGSYTGSATPNLYLGANNYFNGTNFIYSGSYAATKYEQTQGAHAWFNAASGTAGNAITFTQAMTLTADGNLGIGTTSPVAKLTLSAADPEIRLIDTSGTTTYGSIRNIDGRLVIDSDATDSLSSSTIEFRVDGFEYARIDAGGKLLVGTTSNSNTSGTGHKLSPDGRYSIVAPSTTADTFNYYNSTAGAFRFYVTSGGTIFATSTTISAISDQRLKENVRDLEFGLSEVMALKPRRFDWKEGKGQDKKNAAGFIAQEFETVFPDSVGTSKAGEDGIEYKNINHEELIPTLVKAIQELKAEFDAYKATHP